MGRLRFAPPARSAPELIAALVARDRGDGAHATWSGAWTTDRRHFQDLAEKEWSRFQRYQRPLSLLAVGIDHFKSINDGHRHDVGDLAIMHVAKLLATTVRHSDILGRPGGAEYLILLPETELEDAMVLGARLCALVRKTPLTVGGLRLPISLSIGAAQATLRQADITVLMKRATESLYLAKQRGHDQVAALAIPRFETKIAAEQPS